MTLKNNYVVLYSTPRAPSAIVLLAIEGQGLDIATTCGAILGSRCLVLLLRLGLEDPLSSSEQQQPVHLTPWCSDSRTRIDLPCYYQHRTCDPNCDPKV